MRLDLVGDKLDQIDSIWGRTRWGRTRHGAKPAASLRGTPIWRPENSVNIWNLLWLSRRLIIIIEQTSIYVSTFPNALTFKKAQNHNVSIYFSTNSIVDLCHAPP